MVQKSAANTCTKHLRHLDFLSWSGGKLSHCLVVFDQLDLAGRAKQGSPVLKRLNERVCGST